MEDRCSWRGGLDGLNKIHGRCGAGIAKDRIDRGGFK